MGCGAAFLNHGNVPASALRRVHGERCSAHPLHRVTCCKWGIHSRGVTPVPLGPRVQVAGVPVARTVLAARRSILFL